MALRFGDEAPNFTAETTEGTINFHEWLGNSWGILFSQSKRLHPRLHHRARHRGENYADFKKRGVKVIAVSVDPTGFS